MKDIVVPNRLIHEFRAINYAPRHGHAEGQRRFALTWRPADRHNDAFEDAWVRYDAPTLYVLSRRFIERDGVERLCAPLACYRAVHCRHTGMIRYAPQAAYDTALSGREHGSPAYLNPRSRDRNNAVRMTVRLFDASKRGDDALARPIFPDFWFGFFPNQLPTIELSDALLQFTATQRGVADWRALKAANLAAAGGDAAATNVADYQAVEAAWKAVAYERDGKVWWPQRFFARVPGRRYEVHPLTGRPAPAEAATENAVRDGWVMLDGMWVPQAQQPVSVAADMRPVLGEYRRNDAYQALVDLGYLPKRHYGEWRAEFVSDPTHLQTHQARMGELSGEEVAALAAALRQKCRLGNLSPEVVGEDDLYEAILNPHEPEIRYGRAAYVQVVDMGQPPCVEAMTFAVDGIYADLYSVRPEHAARFESAPSQGLGTWDESDRVVDVPAATLEPVS